MKIYFTCSNLVPTLNANLFKLVSCLFLIVFFIFIFLFNIVFLHLCGSNIHGIYSLFMFILGVHHQNISPFNTWSKEYLTQSVSIAKLLDQIKCVARILGSKYCIILLKWRVGSVLNFYWYVIYLSITIKRPLLLYENKVDTILF